MILIGKLLWYYHDCNDILNIIKNKKKPKTKTHRNRIDHSDYATIITFYIVYVIKFCRVFIDLVEVICVCGQHHFFLPVHLSEVRCFHVTPSGRAGVRCEPAESLQSVSSDGVVCGRGWSIDCTESIQNPETSKPRPGLTVTKDVLSPVFFGLEY